MAAQKQEETALMPPVPAGHIVPSGQGSNLNPGQKRAMGEYRTQQTVIDASAAKTVAAQRALSEMAIYTTTVGVHTLEHIETAQAGAQSPTVRSFCDKTKQLYIYQAGEILSTGGAAVHREVSRPLHPTELPRRKLFGG
jgi:hypothetical protein